LRGDFETEFENDAEEILADMEFKKEVCMCVCVCVCVFCITCVL
jgi:hypothetical protein